MRRLAALLGYSVLAAGLGATPPLETARRHGTEVETLVAESFQRRADFGAKLAVYAALPAGNPARVEALAEAARRVLAGGVASKRTPDETIFRLDALADAIFAAADAAEIEARTARREIPAQELANLRAQGHLARFHARRIVAAMHYNLFLRGQRLAELVAATYAEKDAVVAWRQLVTLPAPLAVAEARRAELKKLEASLKDLEDQCCPPDENILKEKVWQPMRAGPSRETKP